MNKLVKQKEMHTHYDWLIKYMNDKLSGSEHEEKCKKDSLITKLQNENQKLKRENQSFIKELANKDVKINKLSDEIQSVKMRNVEEIALNIAASFKKSPVAFDKFGTFMVSQSKSVATHESKHIHDRNQVLDSNCDRNSLDQNSEKEEIREGKNVITPEESRKLITIMNMF